MDGAASVPFIELGVNQRPLLLCLSVPNLITGGGDPPHTGLWIQCTELVGIGEDSTFRSGIQALRC